MKTFLASTVFFCALASNSFGGGPINFSTLFNLGRGETAIAGFVIPSGTDTYLIRAIGPSLSLQGVVPAAGKPSIALYQGGQLIAENDDWCNPPGLPGPIGSIQNDCWFMTQNLNVFTMGSKFAKAGAFLLPAFSNDAALIQTLAPGVYTVQVTNNGTPGKVLVEIYMVPPAP